MRWVCIAAAAILLVLQTASYHSPGGFLGVTLGAIPEELQGTGEYRGPGVYVVGLVPGSSAARAGLRAGDIIIQLEELTITEPAHLRRLLDCYAPGDDVRLRVWRRGRHMDMTATLDPRGGRTLGSARPYTGQPEPWLGIRVEPVGGRAADHPGTTSGVLVSQVGEGSPAHRAGIRAGDVITTVDGEPVSSPAALPHILGSRCPGGTLLLGIGRDGAIFTTAVNLDSVVRDGWRDIQAGTAQVPDEGVVSAPGVGLGPVAWTGTHPQVELSQGQWGIGR
jgi:serine protease Do